MKGKLKGNLILGDFQWKFVELNYILILILSSSIINFQYFNFKQGLEV